MVEHPADYPWSSYRVNGQGSASEVVKAHSLYESLGAMPEDRQSAYRELFRHELDPGVIDEIRDATNGNFVLGEGRFAEQVESMLGRRVRPGKSGRPPAKL